MSKQREALEIALEAMEDHAKQYPHMQKGYTLDAIEALREALAEPEQKPTGIIRTIGGYPDESQHTVEWLVKHKDLHDGDKLYASPPARKPAGTVTGWYGGHPVIEPIDDWIPAVGTVLYSAPPAREPLTDEQLRRLARDAGIKLMNDEALALGYLPAAIKRFAREIERAHGLGREE